MARAAEPEPSHQQRWAIIGAGPSGLAATRTLTARGLEVDVYESASDVGGLWNIDNPRSTVYESAHLISSRTTTQFAEFPMPPGTPDYPGHRALRRYFGDYADRFGLRERIRFTTTVTRLEPLHAASEDAAPQWRVDSVPTGVDAGHETHSEVYDGVILANGTLAEPSVPELPGSFDGRVLHTRDYRQASALAGERVLIVGAGNSGCDIAVDAVHTAASVDMSVRRGYYFVPKYLFGKPADTLNEGRPLPRPLKQFLDARLLRLFTGDPVRFGFPAADYKIYESHPIVNTLVLHHAGQGDVSIRPGLRSVDGDTVTFTDGSTGQYDVILLATGYRLDYPFIDREHLNWQGMAPRLYLNIFEPSFRGVYVMGMIEASGIGWQGRFEQAELLADYLAAPPEAQAAFRARVQNRPWPDLTAGYRYLALERMSYYVNKHAYRREVRRQRDRLARDARRALPVMTHLPAADRTQPHETGARA